MKIWLRPQLPEDLPLLQDRPAVGGAPTAYVCEGFVCQAPVTDAGSLAAALSGPGTR